MHPTLVTGPATPAEQAVLAELETLIAQGWADILFTIGQGKDARAMYERYMRRAANLAHKHAAKLIAERAKPKAKR